MGTKSICTFTSSEANKPIKIMDIIPNVTKRSEVKIGDTCRFIFEDSERVLYGKYYGMKVSKIHTTKSGMIKLILTGTYTSVDGVSKPCTEYFSLGKADKFVIER